MKIRAAQRLLSSLSSVVYHLTSVSKALNILKTNRMNTTPAIGSQAEEWISGNMNYVSFARTPTSRFFQGIASPYSVVLLFDGNKLNTRYKGTAINYWGPRNHKLFEAEDRLYTDKQFITNISRYIKEIRIPIEAAKQDKKQILQLLLKAKVAKINVVWVSDYKQLMTNRYKEVPTPSFKMDRNKKDNVNLDKEYEYRHFKYKMNVRECDGVRRWLILYKVPKNQKLSKELEDTKYLLHNHDIISVISADIHSSKFRRYDEIGKPREAVEELAAIFRKRKWNTKDFVKFLRDKYGIASWD